LAIGNVRAIIDLVRRNMLLFAANCGLLCFRVSREYGNPDKEFVFRRECLFER